MKIPTLVRISLGPHNQIWEEHLQALQTALQTMLDRYLVGPSVVPALECLPGDASSAARRPTPVLLVLGEGNALPQERVPAFTGALQAALDQLVSGPAVAIVLTVPPKLCKPRSDPVPLAA
jgi:hypothetical protein